MQNGTTQWSTGAETENDNVLLSVPANGALSPDKTIQHARSKIKSVFSRRDITYNTSNVSYLLINHSLCHLWPLSTEEETAGLLNGITEK